MAKDLKKLTDEELDREIMALSSSAKSTKDLSDEELEAEINSLMPKQEPKKQERDFIRGAFEAAPAALAGLGGGIGATAAGVPTLGLGAPGGAVVGAGLGGMVGSGIRSLGRRFVYDQPESVGEMYSSAFGKEPIMGAASEAGGQVIAKGMSAAGKGLADLFRQKENAAAIAESAKRLGIKPTTGMTSGSQTLRGMESSLEQAPTLAGGMVSRQTEGVRKGLERGISDLISDTTSLTPVEVGEKVRSGMVARIGEKTGPVSMMFENVKAMTKDIPIDEKSLARVAKNIEGIDEVRLLPKESWSAKAKSYAEALGNAQSADEIATIRKTIGEDFRASEGPERMVLGKIYDKLSKLENNTILRGAVKAARTAKEGKEIGKDLVEESLSARKQWKEIYKSLNEFSQATGLKVGGRENITNILDAIDTMQPEQVAKKFFNTGNIESMRVMSKKFPEQFELLRQAKISELNKASTGLDEKINPKAFLRNIKSMGPEVRDLVFGKDSAQKIEDIMRVVGSAPEMAGPSGTPRGFDLRDVLNPYLNIRDIGRIGVLKGEGPLRSLGEAMRGQPTGLLGESFQNAAISPLANLGTREGAVTRENVISRRLKKLKEGK